MDAFIDPNRQHHRHHQHHVCHDTVGLTEIIHYLFHPHFAVDLSAPLNSSIIINQSQECWQGSDPYCWAAAAFKDLSVNPGHLFRHTQLHICPFLTNCHALFTVRSAQFVVSILTSTLKATAT